MGEFEQGSIEAANAIFAWLGKIYGPTVQRAAIVAWDAGDMFETAAAPPPVVPAPEAILVAGEYGAQSPPHDRKVARLSGYTGDACSNCQSMQVKRNGSCLVCEACGTTTGCS